jgi:hypothetical protein
MVARAAFRSDFQAPISFATITWLPILRSKHCSVRTDMQKHEQVAGAFPSIFKVITQRFAILHRQRQLGLTHHLIGHLVKTDDWKSWLIRLGVQIQDIIHPPHKSSTNDSGNTPFLTLPGFEIVFLAPDGPLHMKGYPAGSAPPGDRPAVATSNARAHLIFLAPGRPFWVSATNSTFSPSSKSTTYFFAIAVSFLAFDKF